MGQVALVGFPTIGVQHYHDLIHEHERATEFKPPLGGVPRFGVHAPSSGVLVVGVGVLDVVSRAGAGSRACARRPLRLRPCGLGGLGHLG